MNQPVTPSASHAQTRRILLLDTAAPDAPGSMRRYADLLEKALAEYGPEWHVQRVRLAPPMSWLQRFPRRLHTWIHHGVVTARARAAGRMDADLFHVLDASHAYVAKALRQPWVATVHDAIPLLQIMEDFGPCPSRPARRLILQSVRSLSGAARILTVSAHTRRDLCVLTGYPEDQVTIQHLPVNPGLPVVEAAVACETPSIPMAPPFILHVGNSAFYKNRQGAVRVFAQIATSSSLRLVMAGAPGDLALLEEIHRLGLADRVRFVPEPDDETLTCLYRTAALLLFPSLYEGFGWPALEAMALGCPVVCSNAASLPEVVGEAALTADPLDEPSLAAHCSRILSDPDLAMRLRTAGLQRARQFTVSATAEAVFGTYRLALSGSTPTR